MQELQQALHKRINPDGQQTKKRHSTRKMQIKLGSQKLKLRKGPPPEWLKSDKLASAGEDVEQERLLLIHCWWEEKLVKPLVNCLVLSINVEDTL